MRQNDPIAITISRQLGSGGALLGKKLALNLNFLYLDREIIKEVAKKLKTCEENIEFCDEKITPVWRTITRAYSFNEFGVYVPPEVVFPSDEEVFKVQSEIITSIVKNRSIVVIGRAASYILKNHPQHVSIFLHSDYNSRLERVKKIYNLTESKAKKLIYVTDKSRSHYIKVHTKQDMFELQNYDLSIDTASIGINGAKDLITSYLKIRFGNNFLSCPNSINE